ncbi:MAG: hypothetical protein CVV24_13800 [Ignavibacteriae bacterium HGW-Ignavibacteriae-3]|nr:MAG: hypothetical protein CVV24_13800 [Ignavibacteriae bacterium HGW-Ignavibacteriae-3]
MSQDILVFAIIGLSISYAVYSVIKSLMTRKTKSSCGGCNGCEVSKNKISCHL